MYFLADLWKHEGLTQIYAAAKFAKDVRQRTGRRSLVIQLPDNEADLLISTTTIYRWWLVKDCCSLKGE